MKRLNRSRILLAMAIVALSACAGESPVSPSSDLAAALSRQNTLGTAGVYQIGFYTTGLVPVTTLVAGSAELILGAHVTDAAGAPAQGGSVTFQYCSRNGRPNDISNADEAPTSDCLSGAASWARLTSVPVDASGNAYMDFGLVMIPRTVGFRFTYSAKGGSVASGTSAPADFTWVAAS